MDFNLFPWPRPLKGERDFSERRRLIKDLGSNEIVEIADILPENKIVALAAAFKAFKGESLGELKEIHGDKFSWDELRLFKASLK